MSIATNLRTYRKLSALKQEQVALALGIERSTYSYYETGKTVPGLDTLVSLSKLFGVDLYALIDYKPYGTLSQPPVAYNVGHSEDFGLPINRLYRDEQELIMAYRLLSDEEQNELRKKASTMLQRKRELEDK